MKSDSSWLSFRANEQALELHAYAQCVIEAIFGREHRNEISDVLIIVRSQLESSLDDAAIRPCDAKDRFRRLRLYLAALLADC